MAPSIIGALPGAINLADLVRVFYTGWHLIYEPDTPFVTGSQDRSAKLVAFPFLYLFVFVVDFTFYFSYLAHFRRLLKLLTSRSRWITGKVWKGDATVLQLHS